MLNIRIGLYLLHALFYRGRFSLFFLGFFSTTIFIHPLTAKIYSNPNIPILLSIDLFDIINR